MSGKGSIMSKRERDDDEHEDHGHGGVVVVPAATAKIGSVVALNTGARVNVKIVAPTELTVTSDSLNTESLPIECFR